MSGAKQAPPDRRLLDITTAPVDSPWAGDLVFAPDRAPGTSGSDEYSTNPPVRCPMLTPAAVGPAAPAAPMSPLTTEEDPS